MPARIIALLVLPSVLLFTSGQGAGQTRVQEYTPPYEMPAKDLSAVYGRYEIYEADRYRGGDTTDAEAQAWVGQELIVTATLFRALGDRIENPRYSVWFYPLQPRYNVPKRAHRWSSHYYGSQGQAPGNEFHGKEGSNSNFRVGQRLSRSLRVVLHKPPLPPYSSPRHR